MLAAEAIKSKPTLLFEFSICSFLNVKERIKKSRSDRALLVQDSSFEREADEREGEVVVLLALVCQRF